MVSAARGLDFDPVLHMRMTAAVAPREGVETLTGWQLSVVCGASDWDRGKGHVFFFFGGPKPV